MLEPPQLAILDVEYTDVEIFMVSSEDRVPYLSSKVEPSHPILVSLLQHT